NELLVTGHRVVAIDMNEAELREIAAANPKAAFSYVVGDATDDETRSFLMPINKKYPLADLLAALKGFDMPRRRRITVEYVLLKGVNDGVEHARRLVRLLHGIRAKVNLIPFNPWPGCPFEAPEPSRVLEFEAVLRDSPFTVMIRKEKGKDILGACGQLAGGIP
ncbi:MAG TPA: 23S rRNA (adenine(2503)-C(2))-methyltransferase RlmN, partial [Deltaproteobacteria bacterium]|nr:23S rRNA (adenine(2503)-C(2))-methyltransferase RlmN [Deltaproteobacteria bacterium]